MIKQKISSKASTHFKSKTGNWKLRKSEDNMKTKLPLQILISFENQENFDDGVLAFMEGVCFKLKGAFLRIFSSSPVVTLGT